jgi:hypothetical protein
VPNLQYPASGPQFREWVPPFLAVRYPESGWNQELWFGLGSSRFGRSWFPWFRSEILFQRQRQRQRQPQSRLRFEEPRP